MQLNLGSKEIITGLRKEIESGLPGLNAHKLMSPVDRIYGPVNGDIPVQSAVCIILNFSSGIPCVLFIERAIYNGVHSGQIAFPGGKYDAAFDSNLQDTVIRETFEEVGLRIKPSQIIGVLTPLYIPASNMIVSPYVTIYKDSFSLHIDPSEVNAAFSLPVAEFKQDHVKTGVFSGNNYQIEAPYYDVENLRIWGATAMIMTEFVILFSRIYNV